MEVQQVLHMNEGSGETSYAQNSQVQKNVISKAKPTIEGAIQSLYSTTFPESLGIADLGCSSGPNTLLVVSEIIDVVEGICRHANRPLPEFRVFLNDLPGNDFNNVFKSLPAFYEKLKNDKGSDMACFIAGVPGSFYGRLFPKRSLEFVHSANSLHWLSQVPPELVARGSSTSLNKGRVFISKESPTCVIEAYIKQFQRDFPLFLKSRSEELVAGGRMVLTFNGRSTTDPTSEDNCLKWDVLAHVLNGMVSEGLVEKEKVDSFSIPYYSPSIEEIKSEIQREGSFVLDHQEVSELQWVPMDFDNIVNKEMDITRAKLTKGDYAANVARAILESMLKNQFGEKIIDELFKRLSDIINEKSHEKIAKTTNLVISLTRKG